LPGWTVARLPQMGCLVALELRRIAGPTNAEALALLKPPKSIKTQRTSTAGAHIVLGPPIGG
jgi:hypothetical protein